MSKKNSEQTKRNAKIILERIKRGENVKIFPVNERK